MHAYPDGRFIYELGKDYRGVPFMGAPDESVYLSRIAAVIYRDDLRLANVGTYGHQGDTTLLSPLPEVVEGLLGKFFNLGVWQTDILATFLLPALLTFLIYLLAYRLSSSFKCAVVTALALMFGYYWLTPNLNAILNLSSDYFSLSLLFVRPISPQFHFIPFILSLYLIYRLTLLRSYSLAVLTGLIVGSLFYMSIYYWTFIYSGLGILLIVDLAKRRGRYVTQYLLVFLVSFLTGLPYWSNHLILSRLKHFPEIFARSGALHTHRPIIPKVEMVFLIILILLKPVFAQKKEQFFYMAAFIFAGLLCMNQQIITGNTIQPAHWQFYTNKVFLIISLLVTIAYIFRWAEDRRYAKRLLSILKSNFSFGALCLFFSGIGLIQQNLYYSAQSPIFRKLQEMGPVLKYIHRDTPADSVILTDPFRLDEERLISVVTKNYPYISASFFMTSVMTLQEIEERFLFALSFLGYRVSEAQGLFHYMNGGLFRGMQVHPLYGGTSEKNNAYSDSLKKGYERLLRQDAVINLKKYKVDYVLLKKADQHRLLSNARVASILGLSYSDDLYAVYKIKNHE